MPKLRIPDHFKSGVSMLLSMTDDSFNKLSESLTRAPSSFVSKRELHAWISSEVPTLSSTDIEQVLDLLTSLYRVHGRSKVSLSRLVEDVTSSVRETFPDLQVQDVATFDQRLSSLLSKDALNVVEVKAKELQMQDERLLLEARIITDIRPVFAETIDGLCSAAVVVHKLKIRYHDSGTGEPREIFIALDKKDIGDLKKMLERAEEKASSLKSSLETTQIKLVDLD